MSADRDGGPAEAADWLRWRAYLLAIARAHPAAGPGGPVDPSDVVQEALADAVRQRDRFRGTTAGRYAAWLRRILAGRMADAVRAGRRRKRDAARGRSLDAPAGSSAGWAAVLMADQSSPSDRAMRAEDLLRLADALATLPDAQRTAVLLRYGLGWPIDRLAAHLNRSPAAAAGLLKRGLKQLRQALDTPETDP
jgi:RNA polymerase sigma-70 factor (ECF subfamily)